MNCSASRSPDPGVPLVSLAARQIARIIGFDLPPERCARLLEMGLTTEAQIQLIRFAPLGDPIEIEVRGYRLSLRKREAAGIRVAVLKNEPQESAKSTK